MSEASLRRGSTWSAGRRDRWSICGGFEQPGGRNRRASALDHCRAGERLPGSKVMTTDAGPPRITRGCHGAGHALRRSASIGEGEVLTSLATGRGLGWISTMVGVNWVEIPGVAQLRHSGDRMPAGRRSRGPESRLVCEFGIMPIPSFPTCDAEFMPSRLCPDCHHCVPAGGVGRTARIRRWSRLDWRRTKTGSGLL